MLSLLLSHLPSHQYPALQPNSIHSSTRIATSLVGTSPIHHPRIRPASPPSHEVARKERSIHPRQHRDHSAAAALHSSSRPRPRSRHLSALNSPDLHSYTLQPAYTAASLHSIQCPQPCLHPNLSPTPRSPTLAAPAPLGLPRASSCCPLQGLGPTQRPMASVFRWRIPGYASLWWACPQEARA